MVVTLLGSPRSSRQSSADAAPLPPAGGSTERPLGENRENRVVEYYIVENDTCELICVMNSCPAVGSEILVTDMDSLDAILVRVLSCEDEECWVEIIGRK